jgi:hypothetical protein
VGLIGRLAAGLDDAGITAGAQGFLRLGSDQETNLLIGAIAITG